MSARLQRSPPCVPSSVATVFSYSPLPFHSLFFHSVSRTSSVFKVQTSRPGCLSPRAVIDRLTLREREKERDNKWYQAWARARKGRLESLSGPEGLFLSVSVRHYWPGDILDAWGWDDGWRAGWRETEVGGRARGEMRCREVGSRLIWRCRWRDWQEDKVVYSRSPVSGPNSPIVYCQMGWDW